MGRIVCARGACEQNDGMSKRVFIREWRKYRGLTLMQLSQRVGITQPSLSRIETGKQPYSQPILEALAEALACEPSDLIGRLPGAPNELTVLINRVPPDAVDAVTNMIKAIIKAA